MRKVTASILLACLSLLLGAVPGHAHESTTSGGFEIVLGWGEEPAYAGMKNSVQVLLSNGGKPVTTVGDGLTVEVVFGEQRRTFSLEPNFEVGEFGTPGDYRAWFVPTRAGRYSFHLSGTVSGKKVDTTVTSSETTFDDVIEPSDVQFPEKDPSVAQVGQRIDREVPRLTAAAAAARSTAGGARTLSLVAIVVGALALAAALIPRKRPSA